MKPEIGKKYIAKILYSSPDEYCLIRFKDVYELTETQYTVEMQSSLGEFGNIIKLSDYKLLKEVKQNFKFKKIKKHFPELFL